jgi:predicted KAP-like P-loop ATPase
MKHSDKPISHPRNDVLGRAEFARLLARSVDRLTVCEDGFVIGLIGEWGAGKSSVIELISRFLRHSDMARHAGDEACSLADLEEMSEAFDPVASKFKALEERNLNLALWERSHREREFEHWFGSEDLANKGFRYWRLKRAAENEPYNLVVRFSPWLIAGRAELASALLSDIARAAGEKLGDEVREAFSALLARLSEFGSLAGAGVDAVTGGPVGSILAAGTEVANKLAKKMTTGPTLDDVRERLKSTLRKLKDRKLVIIVDDLDRLTPAEATEMVSLVKSLGDLPNVVYILSYDRARLSGLIGRNLGVNGDDFLGKIVQYTVNLPLLDEDQILSMFNRDLSDLLPDLEADEQDRLGAAWYNVIRHYLRTPRDVVRLINAYSIAFSGLSDLTDPVDLLIIETLRLFEESVYDEIRRSLPELVS